MPRVSIVLLSYNQSEFLRDAVESALTQTFGDLELVVIDNGSTDGSQDILAEYRDRPNVRLFLHDKNLPITQRLNQGIAASLGEYVSLLFSDDYYLPNKLEQQVSALDRLDPTFGVVYSPGWSHNVVTDQKWLSGAIGESGRMFERLLELCPAQFVVPISPLYRRQCFVDFPFHEDLFQEGEGILFRIALRWQFFYQSEPTVVMRDHGRNIGKATKRNHEIFCELMGRLRRERDFPASAGPLVDELLVRVRQRAGWGMLRTDGDAAWARQTLLKAVRTSWRRAVDPKIVLGVGLSLLTPSLRRAANRALDLVLRPSGTRTYVENYRP
jgi:glycosyltransferase involved in cell wall biosynthesis